MTRRQLRAHRRRLRDRTQATIQQTTPLGWLRARLLANELMRYHFGTNWRTSPC